jgi:hypothetical protein
MLPRQATGHNAAVNEGSAVTDALRDVLYQGTTSVVPNEDQK